MIKSEFISRMKYARIDSLLMLRVYRERISYIDFDHVADRLKHGSPTGEYHCKPWSQFMLI